jgi:hypothetical protein
MSPQSSAGCYQIEKLSEQGPFLRRLGFGYPHAIVVSAISLPASTKDHRGCDFDFCLLGHRLGHSMLPGPESSVEPQHALMSKGS